MKKVAIIVGIICGLAQISARSQSLDQNYHTALGVKVWGFSEAGVSIKHFISSNAALEGIGYFWYHGTRATGLYEFHFDTRGVPGLKWYVGPGAHIGIYDNKYRDQRGITGAGGLVGIDGVIGLDYKFNKVPINISFDWQPSVQFGTDPVFQGGFGGFGIRYAF